MLFGRESLEPGQLASLRAAAAALGRPKPRILSWARTVDGALVALPDSLAVPSGDGWSFVPWHEVLRVSWSADGKTMRWALADDVDHEVAVVAPRTLPAVVRERIEQTFVIREAVELAPGKGATITARRPADGRGVVVWTVVASRGVDLSRPDLREAAERRLDAIRAVWG